MLSAGADTAAFFPAAMSTQAAQVDHLAWLLLAFCCFVAAGVMVTIVFFCIKYQARAGQPRRWPRRDHLLPLELAWTVGPIVVALVFFGWGAQIYLAGSRPPVGSVDVLVVAKQWFWEFQHDNGVREVGSLHVPAHRPVRLLMTSEDVIHSFYVPAFRLKQDVLPLQYTITWFTATAPGNFRINCTEFCGALHARMDGIVTAMEATDYAAWLARQKPAQNPRDAGRELFVHHGCASCHTPASGHIAPGLAGLYGSTVWLSDGSSLVADEAYLRESIIDPAARIVAGYRPIMPVYAGRFSEFELFQLVDYLKHLTSDAETSAPRAHTEGGP